MKFTLKNIGLIKNSEIKLDGLTVITGHNNSGKTTVGKALYACIEGASNIENKFENYKLAFLRQLVAKFTKIYKDIIDDLEQFIENRENIDDYIKAQNLLPQIKSCFSENSTFEEDCKDLIKLLSNFLNENIHISFFKPLGHQLKRNKKLLDEEIINKLKYLNQLKMDDFLKDNINSILNKEFSHQIQPVKNKSNELISELHLKDGNDINIFDFIIINNELINDKSTCKFIEYSKVFLIDNPFIIDELSNISLNNMENNNKLVLFYKDMFNFETSGRMPNDIKNALDMYNMSIFINSYTNTIYNKNLTHNNKLKRALGTEEYSKNILEKRVYNHSNILNHIMKLLNKPIPGNIKQKNQGAGFEYIHNDYSLNLSNLATGTKLFAIMKILLDKGAIDSNTILILDEPESHLHPEWQNIFAELLVLLVKDVDCRILLTTHSPNFLLAIEAFMYKHNIKDKCNFYKTQFTENNEYVDYILTEDTDDIYDDFLKYLTNVKILRDNYI